MLSLTPPARTQAKEKIRGLISELSPEEAEELEYDWQLWARDEQLPPAEPWSHWLIWAGRGWGKTRTGAETVRVWKNSTGRIALVGRTLSDAMEVMVEGESGILNISPRWDRPKFIRSRLRPRLVWSNGAKAYVYSSKNPDSLRGPQHAAYWADELASWYYLDETWENLMFGLRLGKAPRGVITTTPRPIPFLKAIKKTLQKGGDKRLRYSESFDAYVTSGWTYDNLPNLAPTFRRTVLERYEGTRKGRQEIYGELLEDVEGALWNRDMIETNRIKIRDLPDLERIVVAIDPPGSKSRGVAGLVVEGRCRIKGRVHLYTLEDASGKFSPAEWSARAISAYERWSADRIIAERNYGGDMVEHTIRTADGGGDVPVTVINATRGKEIRAEPVRGLGEQGRDHMVGQLPELEDEMCTWTPEESWSPNRLDAKVWASTALAIGRQTRQDAGTVRGHTAG